MAVYFAPKNNGVTLNDLLYMVGGGLLNNMLARDAAARDYKYKSRLETEAADRASAEKRGYIDMLRDGANSNPNQQAGAADFLGGAIGAGANIKDLQPYWLPNMSVMNTGDKISLLPSWSNGEIGEGKTFDMGIDPYKAKELASKEDMFNKNLAWQKDQDTWERGYKNKALAQDAYFKKAGLNREHPAQLIPDGKGGYVWVDTHTRTISPASGIVSGIGNGVNLIDTLSKASNAYKNLYGGGQGVLDAGGQSQAMDPIKFLELFGILGNNNDSNGAVNVIPGSGNPGGLTDAEIDQYARNRKITREAALKELSKFK